MFAKVVAHSVPSVPGTVVTNEYPSVSENLSGLFANVCYSSGYDPDSIEDKLQAIDANHDRFDRVSGTGHHSIADHPNLSIYFGGIGKITAMVLNSLGCYATSERSGRYTDMSKTATKVENRLYNKWADIIHDRIDKVYPEFDSVRKRKLAQENARYFIDVTGPYTSMTYTTSYRQWSYITQWFDNFIQRNVSFSSPFRRGLIRDFMFIKNFLISEGIGNAKKLQNIRNRKINFLTCQEDIEFPDEEQFGRMYLVFYDCSFSCLAQAHRHRTLKYLMQFDDTDSSKFKFYSPTIIKSYKDILIDDLTEDWEHDMVDIVNLGYVPQGILVHVAEMGDVADFIQKCEERICGRAQREVAMLTADTLNKLFENTTGSTNEMFRKVYNSDAGRWKAKCELLTTCSEPCEFKAQCAVDRLI